MAAIYTIRRIRLSALYYRVRVRAVNIDRPYVPVEYAKRVLASKDQPLTVTGPLRKGTTRPERGGTHTSWLIRARKGLARRLLHLGVERLACCFESADQRFLRELLDDWFDHPS
jgi:hypothetical protein